MARLKTPTIPDDKLDYYREQLFRQLSHLFIWENLPSTIPQDFIERTLVRQGQALFYKSKEIGHDVLYCTSTGYNRHNMPVEARTYTPNTTNQSFQVERRIRYLSDYDGVENDFDEYQDGVLIRNMEFGQSSREIVDHFATRLYLAQQAFDTNLLWANIPYIFQTSSDDVRLSIERMFSSIFKGEPFIIVDKDLFIDNKDKTGEPTNIPFIVKDLFDVKNEIMMDFHQTVGIDTAGVEKAERTNTLEIQSNTQYTKTVLQIMLEQREKAVEAINKFFGLNISVSVLAPPEYREDEQMEENDTESKVTSIGDFNS